VLNDMVPKVIDVLFEGRIVKGGDRHRALVLAQKGPCGIEEQVDSGEMVGSGPVGLHRSIRILPPHLVQRLAFLAATAALI
jgi:hypothetical protein